MRKFYVLLKKEIKELLTIQVVLPLVITAFVLMFIGSIADKEQEKTKQPQNVIVIDQDQSNASNLVIDSFKKSNLSVELSDQSVNDALETAKNGKKVALIVIPSQFEQDLKTISQPKIQIYTIIRNFSLSGGKEYAVVMSAIAGTNEAISNMLIAQEAQNLDPTKIKKPMLPDEFIVVGNKKANISPNAIMGFVTQQTAFIPIILFFVIVFASQMIATAIANEKENKTLETLLTAPVSRNFIVISKMVGAGLIALLASVVYIFGFKSYIGGLGGATQASGDITQIMNQLGLSLTPQSYVLLGISLFIGILIALSISLILGAFAEDVKSVAGLTSPIMVLVMVPYFLTMFMDVNNLSPAIRYLTYAIPFSHVFLAAPNLFMQNYSAVIIGILYQLVWFVVAVAIAAKIFSTDKIVTMKLNFFKKKV